MATPLRKPPSVKELHDPRAAEYWKQDVYNKLKMVGTAIVNLPLLNPGDVTTFTLTVPGCKPDIGQTVQLGAPAVASPDLFWLGCITADDVVTVTIWNTTIGVINSFSAVWGARVMP